MYNEDSTANEILDVFEIEINNGPDGNLSIIGGEPVVVSGDNETSISIFETYNQELGVTGRVVVIVDSYNFSDQIFGGPFAEPDARQLMFYNTEFYIFEELLLKE